MKNSTCLAFVVVACGLSACGSSSGGNSGTPTELEGTWASDCSPGDSTSSKLTHVFSGSTATMTGTFYSDTNCTTPTMTLAGVNTFTIGEAGAVTGSKKFNTTLVSGSITPSSEDSATSFNQGTGLCGKNDWKAGVTTSVVGLTCGKKAVAVGDLEYDLIKIDGTNLTFGETDAAHDGETEATRPVALDTTVFKKK